MPLTDAFTTQFGRIITRRDVELAVVAHLQAWLPTYLSQVEYQSGLPPHTIPLPPDEYRSYRGGLNFDTWEQSWSPVFIVVVTPNRDAERYGGEGHYLQGFTVQVGVNFVATNEIQNLAPAQGGLVQDTARQAADILGMAACAAILQHGGLGTWPDGSTVSTKTRLTAFPDTSLPYPNNPRIARCVFEVSVLVDWVLTEAAGPVAPFANPYGDLDPQVATVSRININLQGRAT